MQPESLNNLKRCTKLWLCNYIPTIIVCMCVRMLWALPKTSIFILMQSPLNQKKKVALLLF